jgi:hypothetical protein
MRLTNLNDAEGLLDGGLGVEREAGIDLGGNLAGDDLEDLLAEQDEETVKGLVDLVVDRATLFLGPRDGAIQEGGVVGLLGGGQDQGGVGGGILGLVLANGWRQRVVSTVLRLASYQTVGQVGSPSLRW